MNGPIDFAAINRAALAAFPAEAFPSPGSRRHCPDGREADGRPDGKGGYLVTLPHGVLDRLGTRSNG